MYENVLQELRRVYDIYFRLKGGTDISWERKMADLVLSTFDYLQARKDMMELYPSVYEYVSGHSVMTVVMNTESHVFQTRLGS